MQSAGIPYFPLDVGLDNKLKLIVAEFGLTGLGVVVRLFQTIYGGEGYFIEWNDEVALSFAADGRLGCRVVSEIVRAAIRRGIFDKALYEEYHILTSRGIQKRYLEAVKRRKKVEVEKAYLLLDVTLLGENVCILSKNVCILSKNVDNFQQRREEKRKIDEEEDLLSRTREGRGLSLYITETQKFLKECYGKEPAPSMVSSIARSAYLREIEPDLLEVAIRDTAKRFVDSPCSYIDKILAAWAAEGVHNIDDFTEKELRRNGW